MGSLFLSGWKLMTRNGSLAIIFLMSSGVSLRQINGERHSALAQIFVFKVAIFTL